MRGERVLIYVVEPCSKYQLVCDDCEATEVIDDETLLLSDELIPKGCRCSYRDEM